MKKQLKSQLNISKVDSLCTPYPSKTFIDYFPDELKKTKYSLDIIMYQWKWDKWEPLSLANKLTQTVIDLSRSGIKVRVLLNRDSPNSRLTVVNNETKKQLENAGCAVKMGFASIATHAKMWLLDDDVVCLGSHNISKRSLSSNVECSVLIESRQCNSELKRYFNLLWNAQ
jgi:phosphatidylserine/phosphatidylglycerophosphate/cardiolipin synthase-like enzyme